MFRSFYLIILFLLVTGLSAPTFAVKNFNNKFTNTSIQSNANGLMMDHSMNGVKFGTAHHDGNSFTTVSIPDEGLTYEEGKPVLPMVSRFVIVPPTVGIELIVTASDPIRIEANSPPVICEDEDFYPSARHIDLNQTGLYPNKIAEMSEPTIIRGVRLVKITTFPVQYDARDNSFLHYENIQTELKFNDAEPVNPVLHPDRNDRSREFAKFINVLAVNADVLDRDDAETLSPYAGHYLIAAHENCVNPARDFIEWRRKAGYKMDIYSIPSNNAGIPGRVKQGISGRYHDYLEDGVDPFDQVLIIGDRSDHQNCGPAANWVVGAETGESVWGNPQHADYKYGLLEGDDLHMDVGISRWASGNANLMALNVGRTLAYEAEPRMDNPDWFTRGGAGSYHWGNNAQSGWHVSINTNVRWGYEVLQQLGYQDVRFYENYDWDQRAQQYHPWIRDMYNDGSNVILSRAECYNWRSNFNEVVRNTVFPIRLNTSGHGEWATWWMTRSGNGNDLKGPVVSTCGWGGPPTAPMSIFWLNLVKGVMIHDMSLGWGRTFAGVNFESYFPNERFRNIPIYSEVKTDTDCYGDPGIQPWRGVPQILSMDHVETISPLTRSVEVYAFDPDAEGNPPFEGARVTLYVPGDLPDDGDLYAEHEVFQRTKFTDAEGMVRFVFENDPQFGEGTMYVTLTGRELRPVFGEIEIEDPEVAIETVLYEFAEIEGNGNDDINPGEDFNLVLTAANIGDGNDDIEGITAIVVSLSTWVEVEDHEVNFDTISEGNEVTGEGDIIIHIDPSCPDGESRPSSRPVLSIEYHSGELVWYSAIELDVLAPNFTVRSLPGGLVIPAEMVDFDIDIENIGRMDSSPLSAELHTLGMGISVIENAAAFPDIGAGEHERLSDGQEFQISGNSIVVPGSKTYMMVILANEEGFVDTAYFRLQTSRERAGAPQGPDGYGYICFDDTDSDWDISPEYDWIEIAADDRNNDFEGEEIEEFDGHSEHSVGETALIDLPFDTQFYGQLFNKISVCTNGYISMGDQEEITNFQNWPMDQAIAGGMGMIAPFWDWLQLGNNGKVYTYYDEDDALFIIEWYRLRHKQGGNSELTFQVVLYDHNVWVTESGDQNILFQYKNISQSSGPGVPWIDASPYASVGISSVDGTTGLSYTYNNQRPVTSAPMENQRAMLFSTSPRYKACYLFGNVTDVAMGEPIVGAIVMSEHGFTAITDEQGDYEIIDALAEVPFDISARAQGYNDSTQYDFEVAEDDTLEINFALLHPEFSPSTYDLAGRLDPGQETEILFSMQNTGNGPLEWAVDRRLIGNANVDPWEYRDEYLFGEELEDAALYGVAYINNTFYVSGANKFREEDGGRLIAHPTVYILDGEGALIDTFAQPGEDRYGMRDLTYDGSLIWGALGDSIIGFTLDGEVEVAFFGPYNPSTAITWDPDHEVLWIAGTTNAPLAYDREGNRVEDMEVDRAGLYYYGLAYFEDDPDNAPLYILHKERETNRQTVHKHNFDTGEKTFVTYLEHQEGGIPKGAFITNTYDVYSWVLISVSDNAAYDRVDVHQIEVRKDWFKLDLLADEEWIEASSGILETGEFINYLLTLNSTDLPETTFVSELFYTHNADSGLGHINVELDVIGPEPPIIFDLVMPADGDTLDTTAVTFTWNPSFDFNFFDTLTYEAWFTIEEDTFSFAVGDTSIEIVFDTLNYNLEWMYENPTEWWVRSLSGEDEVESAQHYHFYIREPVEMNNIDDPLAGIPVEFSIAAVYPNPFNSSTTIKFGVDVNSLTSLRVFDIMGRELDVLYSRTDDIGWKTTVWNADRLPSGIYIFRLESAGRVRIAKTALMR